MEVGWTLDGGGWWGIGCQFVVRDSKSGLLTVYTDVLYVMKKRCYTDVIQL